MPSSRLLCREKVYRRRCDFHLGKHVINIVNRQDQGKGMIRTQAEQVSDGNRKPLEATSTIAAIIS